MPLGFLEGLASGFGEQAELARERNRQKADQEWAQKKNFLDDVLSGRYGQPTPETLQEALQGMAELAQGPKPKKGRGLKGRITGEMESALPSLLQRILSGEAPFTDEDRPEGPVNAEGRPDVSLQERAAPTATEQTQGLPPPPGQQPSLIPQEGASPGFQRFAVQMPPASNMAESSLADAATRAAGQMGATGPLPSRAIRGTATPSPMEKKGPAGLFYSPDEAQRMALDASRREMLGGAGARRDVYQSHRDAGIDDSLARSMEGWTQDPALSTTGGHPFASTTPRTFVNPADPSQKETFWVYKDGGIRTKQGMELPPGWVEEGGSAGARPRLEVTTTPDGRSYVHDLDRVLGGDQTAYAALDPSTGLPTSVPIGPGDRTITEDQPDVVRAQGIKDAIDDEVGTLAGATFGITPEELQVMQDQAAQRYGFDSYQAVVESGAAPTQTRRPTGRSLPPPPSEESSYRGTPGIIPGPGAPGGEEWLAPFQIPDELTIDTAGPEDLINWYFNNTAEGQSDLSGIGGGDANLMAESAMEDPSYLDYIRQILRDLSMRIHGSPTVRR